MIRYWPWVSRVVLVVSLILMAFVLRRYEFERLDERAGVGMEGRLRPNAFLILRPVDEESPLAVGSLVEARVRVPDSLRTHMNTQEGLILSRIAASAGQTLSFAERPNDLLEVLIDGIRTFAYLPRDPSRGSLARGPLTEGPIPDDHFLLLNPNLEADSWDSRRLGLIPRKSLSRRILTYF